MARQAKRENRMCAIYRTNKETNELEKIEVIKGPKQAEARVAALNRGDSRFEYHWSFTTDRVATVRLVRKPVSKTERRFPSRQP